MILKEALKKLNPKALVAIGSAACFLYVGEVDNLDERLFAETAHRKPGPNIEDLLNRKILRTYRQQDADYALVIIIEGDEVGRYWLKSECDRDLARLPKRRYKTCFLWRGEAYAVSRRGRKSTLGDDDPVECPMCGGEELRKAGKYKGRQKYKCMTCNQSFYGDGSRLRGSNKTMKAKAAENNIRLNSAVISNGKPIKEYDKKKRNSYAARNNPRCPVCGGITRKGGKENGKQTYRCIDCNCRIYEDGKKLTTKRTGRKPLFEKPVMPKCPCCGGDSQKNWKADGKQRYRCKDCGNVFFLPGEEPVTQETAQATPNVPEIIFEAMPKKKRGRSKKINSEETKNAPVSEAILSEAPQAMVTEKKKRGKPKKTETAAEPATEKKKRGRPKKVQTTDPGPDAGTAENKEPSKRRRSAADNPKCPHCGGDTFKYGKSRNGKQRYICKDCKRVTQENASGIIVTKDNYSEIENPSCPHCGGVATKKGTKGIFQRYICKDCGKTFFGDKDNQVLAVQKMKKAAPVCLDCGSSLYEAGNDGKQKFICENCGQRFMLVKEAAEQPIQMPEKEKGEAS